MPPAAFCSPAPDVFRSAERHLGLSAVVKVSSTMQPDELVHGLRSGVSSLGLQLRCQAFLLLAVGGNPRQCWRGCGFAHPLHLHASCRAELAGCQRLCSLSHMEATGPRKACVMTGEACR